MNDFDELRASREAGHPSARALETRAFAPEGAASAPEVEHHLRACDSCRERVAALREERTRFLRERPASAFVSRVLERQPRTAWWTRPFWAFGVLPMAVAAALVLLLVRPGDSAPPVRLKGLAGLSLELLVSHEGAAARAVAEDEPLGPGDVLRFRVTVPGEGHVFIANLDEAGHFTRYFPLAGARGAPLEGGAHLLPGGVVLDDARGEERITVFFSPEPLEERDVEAALRGAFQRAGGLHFEELAVPGRSVSRFHRKAPR
jgi:hypothetical protein